MLKIGEFARLAQVSIKTLRHYGQVILKVLLANSKLGSKTNPERMLGKIACEHDVLTKINNFT